MKKRIIYLLVLFAVVSFAKQTLVAQPKAGKGSEIKTILPADEVPLGLGFNIHIKGPDSEWDKIRATGVRFIRADFGWGGIERTRGQYNFDAYDKMLAALDKSGIRAIFILDYRNNLYTNPENTDEGREAYSRWAAESAKHFKGRNVIWEIWNEPNVGFWKGTGELNSVEFADQYVALVKKTVPAMRTADPDCYILGGSVSCLWRNSFRWVDETFKQGLLQTGINALSVHPYGYPRPELCMEGGIPGEEGYTLLREKMAKAGAPKNFPVVNTEVGYSTREKGVLRGDSAQDQRAMLFVRTYIVDQMCDIRTTIWYNWDENDAETHKVRSSGPEPLPIYSACKNMNAELTGYHFVERLNVGTPQDYIALFENKSKGRKIVAWTTPLKREETQDKAKPHDVTIPTAKAIGAVKVRDLYGKDVATKVAKGTVTLTLTCSPLYIDLSGKPVADPGL